MRHAFLLPALIFGTVPSTHACAETAAAVESAMFGDHRSAENQERNRYRHPVGTLTFFGLEPNMKVMEISPGSGWYSEILAPVLHENGQLTLAIFDDDVPDQPAYRYRLNTSLREKMAADPEIYGKVKTVPYSPPQSPSLGEPASQDMILTFRNAHGWVGDGIAEGIFAEFFRVLKPGGTLGVVQHRAPADMTASGDSGYLHEQTIIDIAKAAGFRLDSRSEVNANPEDTHDHPEGVWTLPPSLRLGETDREKYMAIGESDRMTLKFVKP